MKRHIELTSDLINIKSILKEDYDLVTYDGCPDFQDFVPDTDNSIWFILKQDSYTTGLIKLESLNLITWIPHIIIKKEYRGAGSEQWGRLVAKYMKDRLKDVNFLIMTPYETARRYAERMGFKLIGILPKSMKKNGKLMDQYMLSGCPDKSGEIK
jgi:RimJ/RimL family protein N-acetyltransferase